MKSEQHIQEWNKDGVWKNVEAKLHKKKKRRFFILWPFVGLVAFLLLVLFIWNNNFEHHNTPSSDNSNINTEEIQNSNEIENKLLLDKTIAVDHQAKQNPNITLTQKKISQSGPTPSNNNSTFSKKPRSISKHRPANEILSPNNGLKSKLKSKVETNLTSKQTSASRTEVLSYTQNSSDKKIANSVTNNAKIELLSTFPILPNYLGSFNFERSQILLNKKLKLSTTEENKTKETSTFWWVESGLSSGSTSYINLNNEHPERTAAQQFRFTHTSAIGIQSFLTKNWSLKVGLAYQTIYEKYEQTHASVLEEERYSEEAIEYTLTNGLIYYEPGITTVKSTTSRYIVNNNYIHRLSLPTELAFTMRKNSWSIEPSMGLRFQFFQRFNGIISKDENHFFNLEEINNNYYSNKLGIGLITSLNLKKQIFKYGSLGLKLSYEKDDFLNLINTDFATKYETMGLQLGFYHAF